MLLDGLMSNRPLNIVWRRQVLETVLETAFIRNVLLSKINRPQRWLAVEENDSLPLLDDSLIVSFSDPAVYFQAIRERGLKNIGFFQVGDEKGTYGTESYGLVDYVLRNYHFPGQLAQKPGAVLWVPNGWARGVGPVHVDDHLPFDERQLPAFFSGFVGEGDQQISDRHRMMQVIRDHNVKALMATTNGFGQGLGPAAYASHMGNTRFALCPAGRSAETIRFYDALELGAIPVVIDQPWLHAKDGLGVFGKPPVVILRDWQELPGFLIPYQGEITPERLLQAEQQRRDCVDWWGRIKNHFALRVAELINGTG